MGGMLGAIGALAALNERDRTGAGRHIDSGLFENCVLLVAQHMLLYAVTGEPAAPMPARLSAWGIYDVFTVGDGSQLFLAVVSDTQWRARCGVLGKNDWLADVRLETNPQRVGARDWFMPMVKDEIGRRGRHEVIALATRAGPPWAPITRPEDLFDDPHLAASGGLVPMRLPDGAPSDAVRTPLLPLAWDGARLPLRFDPPRIGQHTRELLAGAGVTAAEIDELIARRIAVQSMA